MPIRHSLLSLLADRPRPAGELRSSFEELTNNTWLVNKGQVFQTLRRLERDGLVTETEKVIAETGHATQLYAITDSGRAELVQWWTSPILASPSDRDKLVIKIAMAEATGAVDVRQLVQRQRVAVMEQLRVVMRTKAQLPDVRTADLLLVERRIFNLEAEIRWLDHIENLTAPAFEGGYS